MACVHTFPLLTPRTAKKLFRQLQQLPAEAPNSMNRYGRYLDDPKWQRWVDVIVAKHVAPLAKRCYGIRLAARGHYAFAVEYDVRKQKSLAPHFDSSDVTLNVCVGGTFKGGDLVLTDRGLSIEQTVGRAIVHRGAEIHQAKPLTRGKRMNVVIWCKRRR